MGTEQKSGIIIANLEADQPSRSILEVSESLRANIYSLLSRLGYLDHPGLRIDDHVTLTIIESYLEFKVLSLVCKMKLKFVSNYRWERFGWKYRKN